MKKRTIGILLVLALLLCGCAKANVSGSVRATEGTAAVPVGTIAQTEVPETTEAAVQETVENSVSLGRMEGGVYSNTYAGFACTLDSDWTFYSAEELQELPANAVELFEGTAVGDAAEELEFISDMMAENVNDLTSMNVLYQKMTMQERLVYASLTEDELMDAMLAQSDTLIESYAQAGMDVTSMEKVTVTFLGEERTGVRTVGAINGVDFYMIQIFDYTAGRYSVTLTMTSYVEDRTQGMLELFCPVE